MRSVSVLLSILLPDDDVAQRHGMFEVLPDASSPGPSDLGWRQWAVSEAAQRAVDSFDLGSRERIAVRVVVHEPPDLAGSYDLVLVRAAHVVSFERVP